MEEKEPFLVKSESLPLFLSAILQRENNPRMGDNPGVGSIGNERIIPKQFPPGTFYLPFNPLGRNEIKIHSTDYLSCSKKEVEVYHIYELIEYDDISYKMKLVEWGVTPVL